MKKILSKYMLPVAVITAFVMLLAQVATFPQVALEDTVLSTESFSTVAADIPNWDEEGPDSDTSTQTISAGSGNDSASPDGSSFAKIGDGEWICRSVSTDNFTSLVLNYYWRGDTDAEDGESG